MHSAEMVVDTSCITEQIGLIVRRIFDLIFSLISLIVLFPVFIIVAILIKLDSKGPVFVTEEKIGHLGKTFKLYKFRTMVANADEVLKELLSKDDLLSLEYRVYKSLRNDPRLTKVGKKIKKLSLENLPQLLNVLKGNMALVGDNSPYSPSEIDKIMPKFETIASKKPGLFVKTSRTSIITYYPYLFIKRAFDIVCSLIGCIMLLPLMFLVKVINLANGDHAKLFYKQKRIGKNGKVINIYKFRTMVPNADVILKEMLKDPKYKEEWDLNQKFENDPRITKAGKFLRKTSIDEFPQFINVLKGDMSFIGPRPLVEGELDSHDGDHKIYESVRPGITGWWACNGRSALDYEERLELEYYYVRNQSITLDIKIVFKTIIKVILGDGAK